MSTFTVHRPEHRIPGVIAASADPKAVREIVFGRQRTLWLVEAFMLPIVILADVMVHTGMPVLYPVTILLAIVVFGTLAANFEPRLFDWMSLGPRAMLVSGERLELVRLAKSGDLPVLVETFERRAVEFESTKLVWPLGTRFRVRGGGGNALVTLRQGRSYGRDGSRLDGSPPSTAAPNRIA